MTRVFHYWILVYLVCICPLVAAPIKLQPGSATTGEDSRFAQAVDGIDSQENGWIVPLSTAQSGTFRCVPAMDAGRLRFSLSFSSERPNGTFAEFSISVTTDANPSADSQWEPIFPTGFAADQGWMERSYPHLRIMGSPAQTRVQLDAWLSLDRVTGIRVESWSSPTEGAGSAVLTELRVDNAASGSTNVALGCPVTASHLLVGKQCAEFLTDGLTGSFAYPPEGKLGRSFFFEIDLRHVRELDHITVRSRAEAVAMNRSTDLLLQLFDEKPGVHTPPTWSGQKPESAATQQPGAVQVFRSSVGKGVFRGRYLRVSSTSETPFSPQIAEVEVYESLVPSGVQVMADDYTIRDGATARIPAGINWLTFTLSLPTPPNEAILGRRWRILGANDKWMAANAVGGMESRGLLPGDYIFEAQLRHTDLEWNSVPCRLPLHVLAPWWKNPAAQISIVFAMTAIAALLAWQISRGRMARRLVELERRQELSRERARIARDMHDVVGARLTQLAMMQELFAAEHPQSAEAQKQLKRLTGTARETISALDETVWAVNPRNDTLQNVADYLCHVATEYFTPLKIVCRQDVPLECPAVEVVSQKRHQLFLAFKEALQNIAKHAAASTVSIILRHESGKFLVRIEDNGRGLPANLVGSEKDGFANMTERLTSIGGTCRVAARPDGGTFVEMQIPL